MTNSKISGLTAATTPLAGTEELALLQTSDKRITVANFAAGAVKSNATTGVLQVVGPVAASTRVMTTPDANFSVARTDALQTFTGNQTITNGNVVVSSGYGIDFSATAQAGGMTSELLTDYEEGTWTPTYSAASGSAGSAGGIFIGRYVKIGTVVHVYGEVNISNKGSWSGVISIGGIPFSGLPGRYPTVSIGSYSGLATNVVQLTGYQYADQSSMYLQYVSAAATTQLRLNVADIAPGFDMTFSITYFTS